jgi:predicted ATPase/class 3 adenylate cyclase
MTRVRGDLPSGTVTFLFTDIEGSTKLLRELGSEAYAEALAEHRLVLREAFARHGGVEVDTQGDAFFVAFPSAPGAIEAAAESQEAFAQGPIRVRMGLHTGTPHLAEEGYVGEVVHEGARIAAVGHGGQVLLSAQTLKLAKVEVTDLGEHRLKDIEEPVPIFQLGPGRFPPLKTISNTNLPHPASSFVGREREVKKVVSLLQDGARLLTLTGPGGTGKTRLAIEAAAELVPEFKAGVFWVGLAPLRDPTLVPEAIARTLGAKDILADHIGERELLLLLDNLEQVVDAAPELASLVEACPNLRLLVTSRELLRVRGEVEYPVLPLADPEAVDLFCARAAAEPDETVHELCRALDNLPLAIELAAARTSVLSPEQILERLSGRLELLKGGRDADPRQQTLRATVTWSYELLSPEERQLFARLSVFAGGCTLDAAQDVTDADLDTLGSLVGKSLLRHTRGRFWMLETIREYATERLLDSAEAEAIQRRHAERFLALAEEACPHVRYDSIDWLDRLEAEHDNLRAALDRLEALEETELVLSLAGAIWRFWVRRGHLAEGRRRLDGALAADERPTEARARALHGATALTAELGDISSARPWAEESLVLHREFGDAWGTALSLMMLGNQSVDEGNAGTAVPLLEESVRRFRELDDDHYTLMATSNLAWGYAELGDRDRARALHDEVLTQARRLDNKQQEAHSLLELAMLALDDGRLADASSELKESLSIWHNRGDRLYVAVDLAHVAAILALEGVACTAAMLLSAAETLRAHVGNTSAWLTERNEKTLTAIRTQLDEAAFTEAWEQGRALTVDEAVALALDALD